MTNPPAIDAENMPDFLWAIRDALQFPLAFATHTGDFTQWQTTTLNTVKAAIGGDLSASPTHTIAATQTFPTHTATRLTLGFPTGAKAAAYMLTPSGQGPFPAVLLLHDHGGEFSIGKEKLIAPWDAPHHTSTADAWVQRFYDGRYLGDDLVKQGYVVLAVDALGWGERRNNGHESQQAIAANLMQFGLSLAGIIAQEDAQAANFLATLPNIDPSRIAAAGLSMGGFRAWQIAALSPTIKAAIAICWMGRMKDLMVPGNNQLRGQSAFNMLHPALGGKLDYPDFAGLAAPKPLLAYAGDNDALFSVKAVRGAFADMATIWTAAGAPTALTAEIWNGGHIFSRPQQDKAFAWLQIALA